MRVIAPVAQLIAPAGVVHVMVDSKAAPALSKPAPPEAVTVMTGSCIPAPPYGIAFPNASDTETASGLTPPAAGNSPDLVAPVTVAVPKYGTPVR